MKKIILLTIAIAILLIIIIGGYFLINRSPGSVNEKTSPSQTKLNQNQYVPDIGNGQNESGQVNEPAEVPVEIINIKFNPQSLSINKGTTVIWTNNDSMQHTVTANDNFDSGILAKGQSFSHKFDTAGTFDYICIIHPNMKGQIIVIE